MEKNFIKNINKIHFIGIGGSGMCPMAEILQNKGYEISGSDTYRSDTIDRIWNSGMKIYLDHKPENIKNAQLVVHSAAIKQTNPEIIAAKENNIPVIERSVMLGLLIDEYKDSIAVAGTHGKTTTTSMITQILLDSGKDPSAIIGGKLNKINSNSCSGKSNLIVCEACEYVDSFLKLFPAISVILNVDSDHLDYFKTFDNIKKSFSKFASQTKNAVFYNGDDSDAVACVKDVKIKKISFGLNKNNIYRAEEIKTNGPCESFYVFYNDKKISQVELNVPGKHNLMNALAAFAVAHSLGIDANEISKSLGAFTGVHRRFEILDKINGITVADDFAHHPTELTEVLNCAMNMGYRKVWAVFQPHTFSRTYMFLDEFAKALSIPDYVIMSEILPVRETNIYNIHTKDLAEKIPGSTWFETFEEITNYIVQKAKPNDLILTLGGGNVYKCANMITKKLKELNTI